MNEYTIYTIADKKLLKPRLRVHVDGSHVLVQGYKTYAHQKLDAAAIYSIKYNDPRSTKEIAKFYGVSEHTVSSIRCGRSSAHI